VTGYLSPDSVPEATAALAGDATARVLAGGSDLMNQLRLGRVRPALVVDLARLGLAGVRVAGGLSIGAATTMRQLLAEPVPDALREAARLLGGRQIQAVATIGGNLCNASPAAETATPLLVHDARAVIAGPAGAREVPLADLFAGPGRVALAQGELLTAVRLPATGHDTGYFSAYRRLDLRRSVDIAVVGASAAVRVEAGVITGARLALGAVAPTPRRVPAAERALAGVEVTGTGFTSALDAAAGLCQEASTPIDDVRASAEYRRAMVPVVVRRALSAAIVRATKGPRP
jgi:CO/xanthine dehydrogenase FAD-binding subunit